MENDDKSTVGLLVIYFDLLYVSIDKGLPHNLMVRLSPSPNWLLAAGPLALVHS